MIKFVSALSLTVLLCACAGTGSAPGSSSGARENDACNAYAARDYVGQQASSDVREALANIATDRQRYISPGDAITADYRIDRMNITLDADGIILTVDCF